MQTIAPVVDVPSSYSLFQLIVRRGTSDLRRSQSDHALVTGYQLLRLAGHLRGTLLFGFKELHMSLCHILKAMILPTAYYYKLSRLPFG